MSTELNALSRELLERLEREEEKLLAWGVVDGGFTESEVDGIAQAIVEDRGSDLVAADLRQALFDRRLLFAFREGFLEPHRTRMGEAVRLFSKLRQMFPNRPWRLAPTLVADFRFARRPRRYPRREIDSDGVFDRLASDLRLSERRRQALSALLRIGEGDPLRLAEFQFQATRRTLLDLEGRYSRGLIVCAGTGTGKTLAFYLPALTHLAGIVERNEFWTKAVAIYPRNELLKDQLSETYAEARRLDDLLLRHTGRKLTIAAFFGDTPRQAADLARYGNWGEMRAGGFVCPFLRCPRCGGDLLWRSSDAERGVEALHCATASCGASVGGDEVILTRQRMCKTPPDVLFTTTEMLNRQMSNSQYGHVFGLGPNTRRPHLMLLDEAHTYTGTSGAQAALLLRRYQHAVGSRMLFTGLSATLRGAAEFFGQLVGLRPGSAEEVSPKESELDPEAQSVEYVMALRGDPVSGTSLLSTSIQTAMLLRRVLDPAGPSPSLGLYGSRVFAFTDDLDVTNRLYNNLQDAEGLDSWNRPAAGGTVLASLRSAAQPENGIRLPAGQSWQMCEDIGHPYGLARPLRLSRTSSQDAGVEQGSDVVVATAALEVGYNDPDVGAVMQHKAPRDWAAFLQRKGRAGRRRDMRPWTAVVLSDYGRDRLAYQSYDQLFDPELPLRFLPVKNRYVLRMQTALSLMDWVARELPPGTPQGSVWADFSGPEERTGWWWDNVRARQGHALRILGEVLDGDEARCKSLENHLRLSLGLTEEETQAVLWDAPRPVMTAVVPTIHRRLETGWRRVREGNAEPALDHQVRDHPLPDFVPQQLFGDLNLPEVEIVIAPQQRGQDEESIFMPIVQSMRTLAPGRVTRRFGYRHAFAHHWMAPPDLQSPDQTMAVEAYCEVYDEAGAFQVWEGGAARDVRCVRPWKLRPTRPPGQVAITSNAQLVWRSQLGPGREDERLCFAPPRGSAWEPILAQSGFFTHNDRNHVLVRRFAVASRASLSFRDGNTADLTVRFVDGDTGRAAAVGFSQEADGIVFRFRTPADLGLGETHPNRCKLRAFRSAYFRQRVRTDPTLVALANTFQRDWLAQIFVSALAERAVADGVGAEEGLRRLTAGGLPAALAAVLRVIFQSIQLPDGGEVSQKVHDALLALCNTPGVADALAGLAPILWRPLDADGLRWAAARYKATLGGALLEACQQSCPQMESGDLYLDIEPGPRPAESPPLPEGIEEVWITESSVGGGGVVEEILRVYADDPRRFFRIAESALAATDFEIVARELARILSLTGSDPAIDGALAAIRAAPDHAALSRAAAALRAELSRRGIVVNHAVMSAVFSRVLRPGSSPLTDALLRELSEGWDAAEELVGVEIDTRVYAYVASGMPQVRAALEATGIGPAQDPFWRFQTVYGLLWARGYEVRALGLSFYNPFAESVPPDREMLLDLLQAGEPSVPLAPGWEVAIGTALAERGAVRVVAPPADRAALKEAILRLAAEPVEAGFLHLYPTVVGVAHEANGLAVTLDMREVLP